MPLVERTSGKILQLPDGSSMSAIAMFRQTIVWWLSERSAAVAVTGPGSKSITSHGTNDCPRTYLALPVRI